jgi:high-affinity iron transporter
VASAFIIVLREVIEAGLIIGIVLAATRGVTSRGWWIAGGVAGGLVGAGIVAVFAGAIASFFSGYGQELFNAAILLVAVGMLTWHNAWMAKHGRELAAEVKSVGQAVASGARPLTALAVVCGIAVLREGSEVVLFLYGVVLSGASGLSLLAGGLLGVLGGAAVTGVSYLGLVIIPQRHIFKVTGWLITLIAAGLAAQAVFYLNAAGVLTIWSTQVWDTSGILSQTSALGLLLHTLVGYVDRPTAMQLVAYAGTIAIIAMLTRYVASTGKPVAAPVRSSSP